MPNQYGSQEKGIDNFHYTGFERFERFTGEFLPGRACEHHRNPAVILVGELMNRSVDAIEGWNGCTF